MFSSFTLCSIVFSHLRCKKFMSKVLYLFICPVSVYSCCCWWCWPCPLLNGTWRSSNICWRVRGCRSSRGVVGLITTVQWGKTTDCELIWKQLHYFGAVSYNITLLYKWFNKKTRTSLVRFERWNSCKGEFYVQDCWISKCLHRYFCWCKSLHYCIAHMVCKMIVRDASAIIIFHAQQGLCFPIPDLFKASHSLALLLALQSLHAVLREVKIIIVIIRAAGEVVSQVYYRRQWTNFVCLCWWTRKGLGHWRWWRL